MPKRTAQVLIVVVAGAMLAGCTVGGIGSLPSSAPTVGAATTPATYELSSPQHLPSDLVKAGMQNALELPRGWVIDGYGVLRDEHMLALGATRGGKPTAANFYSLPDDLWIVNTMTDKAVRYAPPSGWSVTSPTITSGWAVARVDKELPESRCPGGTSAGCFVWQVVAYPGPGVAGKPRVLAKSAHPGDQAFVPYFARSDNGVAWQQGTSVTSSTNYWWQPSLSAPLLLGHVHGQQDLEFDGNTLYGSESGLALGASPHILTQVALPGQRQSSLSITYTSSGTAAINNGRLVYFPKGGADTASWVVQKLPGAPAMSYRTPPKLTPAVNGPYSIQWITPDTLISWSDSGFELYDARTGKGTQIASELDMKLSVPRADDGYLDLAWNPTNPRSGPSMIAWRKY